jgi:hypothetical protein
MPTPTPTPTPPSTVLFGTVKFGVAAEPACGFDAVNVTVTKVRFHMSATAAASDPGWTEIVLQPARRLNLANMQNGALDVLATAALAPGQYAQARLVLDPNSANDMTNSVVVAGSSAEVPLVTQSVAAEGILIDQGFELVNGQTLNLVVDFDACRSVVPNGGQYLLRPYVKAVQTVKNGITGFVATSLLGAHALVTAQQNGVIVRATVPDPVTGEFFLARLNAGNYDVVLTADGRAASVIASVPVASAVSTTALSTAASPLTLQASSMGRIDASLALIPASNVQPAFGSAIQSFASGPVVTINYRNADLGTGAVRFNNVPIAAPLLATYSAGQPLVFSPQAAVTPGAGVYTIAASAPGYTTTRTLPIPTTGN